MDQALKNRLSTIWKAPDFTAFFKKYAKRPPLHIKKGRSIFYEGDQPEKIYFIAEGFVKMHHTSKEGKDTIIYLYGPGSILGVRALTSVDRDLKHDAEAITDVKIITMSREDYVDILAQNPEHLVDLLHVFIERLNYTEKKLEGFIINDATSRVAAFLYNCVVRFGTVLPVPLTHQNIADFVGSFRETITGAIQHLEKEKVLTYKRGGITILDTQKLKRFAQEGRRTP